MAVCFSGGKVTRVLVGCCSQHAAPPHFASTTQQGSIATTHTHRRRQYTARCTESGWPASCAGRVGTRGLWAAPAGPGPGLWQEKPARAQLDQGRLAGPPAAANAVAASQPPATARWWQRRGSAPCSLEPPHTADRRARTWPPRVLAPDGCRCRWPGVAVGSSSRLDGTAAGQQGGRNAGGSGRASFFCKPAFQAQQAGVSFSLTVTLHTPGESAGLHFIPHAHYGR